MFFQSDNGQEFVWIRSQTDVFYSGMEEIRAAAGEAIHRSDGPLPVVIDCSRFRLFDATFMDAVVAIAKELRSRTTVTQRNLLLLQLLPANQEQRQQLLGSSPNIRFSGNNFPTDTELR